MDDVEKILAGAGIRPTAIRIMVMKEIITMGYAFTLTEMEERLDTVDKSTLFRTLTLFMGHRLVHEVYNGSNAKLYCRCECKGIHTSHIYFTCKSCGKTFSIKDVDTSSIPHPNGFVVEDTTCVMTGLCPVCANMLS